MRELVRPLSAIRDLVVADATLERDELEARSVAGLTDPILDDLKITRGSDFWEWATPYLQKAADDVIKSHDHIVTKTTALAGWFGLIFGALTVATGSLREAFVSRVSASGRSVVIVLVASAMGMFIVSLFGVCRVLWRFVFYADSTEFLIDNKYATAEELKRERVVELIRRVPTNAAKIAVKARLYQGAVWAFFVATSLMALALGVMYVGVGLTPSKGKLPTNGSCSWSGSKTTCSWDHLESADAMGREGQRNGNHPMQLPNSATP